MQQCAICQRNGSQDDTVYTEVKHLLDMCHRTHASAKFYAQGCRGSYTGNQGEIHRLALRGGVQVNHVQPACSCGLPALRNLNRVGGVDCDLGIVSLIEAHALTVFDIYGW